MSRFLSVQSDGLVLVDRDGAVLQRVNSVDDFNELVRASEAGRFDLFVSSSVDFPEEYTDDPRVVALAREVRGNSA